MSDKNKRIRKVKELVNELKNLDGIDRAFADDCDTEVMNISLYATPEDDANLRSLSQLVRNKIEEKDDFTMVYFDTPRDGRYSWYDFDLTFE